MKQSIFSYAALMSLCLMHAACGSDSSAAAESDPCGTLYSKAVSCGIAKQSDADTETASCKTEIAKSDACKKAFIAAAACVDASSCDDLKQKNPCGSQVLAILTSCGAPAF